MGDAASRWQAQVQVDVTIHDLDLLRDYALRRALASGVSRGEFFQGQHEEKSDNIAYWIGWAFDAGTPENCGFEIQSSRVEEY